MSNYIDSFVTVAIYVLSIRYKLQTLLRIMFKMFATVYPILVKGTAFKSNSFVETVSG